jgi:hypothetical protein
MTLASAMNQFQMDQLQMTTTDQVALVSSIVFSKHHCQSPQCHCLLHQSYTDNDRMRANRHDVYSMLGLSTPKTRLDQIDLRV